MKNIHILPTKNPGKEYVLGKCIKELSNVKIGELLRTFYMMLDEEYFEPQYVYITSDEEIKEGDWVFDSCKNDVIKRSHFLDINGYIEKFCKKIILTTDLYLIKDGVQAIDDEFLEWFVKNPNCEEVKFYKDKRLEVEQDFEFYEIIIPKEKSKLTNVCIKCGVDLYYAPNFTCQEHPKNCKGIYLSEETLKERALKKQPKQDTIDMKETLEEVAQKYLQEWKVSNNIHLSDQIHAERCKNDFKAGAKWQSEKMYSEEEVRNFCLISYNQAIKDGDKAWLGAFDEWFEQFKKK